MMSPTHRDDFDGPRPPSGPTLGEEDKILKGASALISEGKVQEGLAALRKGVEQFPKSIKLHYGLGRKLLGQHAYEDGSITTSGLHEAKRCLERSIRLLDQAENRAELANQRDPVDETVYPDTLEVNIRYHLGLAYIF